MSVGHVEFNLVLVWGLLMAGLGFVFGAWSKKSQQNQEYDNKNGDVSEH